MSWGTIAAVLTHTINALAFVGLIATIALHPSLADLLPQLDWTAWTL